MHGGIECPEANLKVDPWVLGMWLGDGCKNDTTIAAGFADSYETIVNILECGYKLRIYHDKACNHLRVKGLDDTQAETLLRSLFKNWGFVPRKEYRIRFYGRRDNSDWLCYKG